MTNFKILKLEPKPKRKSIALMLTENDYEFITKLAKEIGCTRCHAASQLMKQTLEQYQKQV